MWSSAGPTYCISSCQKPPELRQTPDTTGLGGSHQLQEDTAVAPHQRAKPPAPRQGLLQQTQASTRWSLARIAGGSPHAACHKSAWHMCVGTGLDWALCLMRLCASASFQAAARGQGHVQLMFCCQHMHVSRRQATTPACLICIQDHTPGMACIRVWSLRLGAGGHAVQKSSTRSLMGMQLPRPTHTNDWPLSFRPFKRAELLQTSFHLRLERI